MKTYLWLYDIPQLSFPLFSYLFTQIYIYTIYGTIISNIWVNSKLGNVGNNDYLALDNCIAS